MPNQPQVNPEVRDLARQFTHPLALLLWAASGLAWIAPVAIAIVVLIVVNTIFAFAQELQAERAVEALAAYLPLEARVLRDGQERGFPRPLWFPATCF